MATIQMKGLDEYLVKLSRLEQASKEEICGKAIYEGAGIVADAIRNELDAIPTDESFGTQEHPAQGIKAIQKAGLEYSLGISEMREEDGFLNVKVGFDGYNRVITKKWPNGQPNQMVARAAESGTSWLQKSPFVKTGTQKAQKKTLTAMKESVSKSIDGIWRQQARAAGKKAMFSGKKSWEK